MPLFDQKPRYYSRPLEWLFSGGRSTYTSTDRFFRRLCEELGTLDGQTTQSDVVKARLISLRGDFRQIMQRAESVPVLQRYQDDINPVVRTIAIWLLGYHANRFILLGIERSRHDFSPLVRKRVARALRRLEARELLSEMAAEYPDDAAIQWFATFTANPKSYGDRLEAYVNSVDVPNAAAIDQSKMPLWFRDEYWSGTPPKSIEYMRAILRRIRTLVHG